MAFEFEPDEPIDRAATRIAHEQLAAAQGWLAVATGDGPGRDDLPDDVDPQAAVATAVHEARKCCKRLRGLTRMVRPAMENAYDATNVAARDAARHLSPIRDAHALLATFDSLVAAHADQVPATGIAGVRLKLAERADAATEDVTTNSDRINRATDLLAVARTRVDSWPLANLDRDDHLAAVAAGIAKTAGRARKRFTEVTESPGPPPDELLHQWRKRVKYSWYHISLLEPAAPTLLGALSDCCHDLSGVLGDDHDLAVLSQQLRTGTDDVDAAEVQTTLVLLEGTRRDLQRRAVAVGARLHAEDPAALGKRLVALLEAWWTHGPERDAGEISDLHDNADDLGDLPNGQLRDLARHHDITGRSRLDRAGLLGALRATEASRGAN